DNVRALVRRSSDDSILSRCGAELVVGDLEDSASLASVCRDCEVVYHAAARVDLVGSDADFQRTTVAGTEALVRAARSAGARRFLGMKFIGKADNPMAMIHVADAVRAIQQAGRVPAAAGQTLIAAGTERVTQEQYFNALADGLGLRRIRRHLPYSLAFWLAAL